MIKEHLRMQLLWRDSIQENILSLLFFLILA
jgi:hypothetical protein